MKPDYLNTPHANESTNAVIVLRKLRQQLPEAMNMIAISTKMESREEISVHPGEYYAQKALARLTEQYLSAGDNKQ